MEQRVSLITLGVRDLARSRAFYKALGWRGQEVEQTVFYQAGGLGIVLWHQDSLADDADVPARGDDGFRGVALAQNLRSRDDVDTVMAAASAAGGRISKPAQETFYGGYAGYFADPDGHVWEIAWNPGFPLADDGTISIPDLSAGT